MLKVQKKLCQGCGRCAITCFRQAISLPEGHAEIDPTKCNGCGLCVDVCPQNAIMKIEPVSKEELAEMVSDLKDQMGNIMERIQRLK